MYKQLIIYYLTNLPCVYNLYWKWYVELAIMPIKDIDISI